MTYKASWRRLLPLCIFAATLPGLAVAQAQEQAAATRSLAPTGYRKLAEGILTTIPANQEVEDTISTHNFVEVLANVPEPKWAPYSSSPSKTLWALGSGTVFRHPVWNVEFSFKPMRMIYVDLPAADGKLERKLIWYMVYRIRNTGGHLKPVRQEDGSYEMTTVDYPVRVFPQFILESHEFKTAYMDSVLPAAVDAIRRREDPNRRLLNNVEISAVDLQPVKSEGDDGVWGVVTWKDVDLRIDFFSVYVKGLSNAYRWTDAEDQYVKGDAPAKGRELTHKTLQLNFWRPGDEFQPNEREIYFGIPGKIDYTWVYR